jgi:hypothetical protein
MDSPKGRACPPDGESIPAIRIAPGTSRRKFRNPASFPSQSLPPLAEAIALNLVIFFMAK